MRCWSNTTGQAFTRSGAVIRFGLIGSADILGIRRGGQFLAIEVKSAVGRQRPEQIAFQRMVEEYGGVYILARSVADVERVLG